MIRLAVFDYNGTLRDDHSVVFGGVVQIHKAFGIEAPTEEDYRMKMTKDFMSFHRSYGFPAYTNGADEKMLKEKVGEIYRAYLKEHYHEAGFRPDVASTVLQLKMMGIKTAIVSAADERYVREELDRYGFRDVFEPVVGGARDKAVALSDLCRQLNVEPFRAIYVDDTEDGTGAAKKAGLTPVGVIAPTAYHSEERLMRVTYYLIPTLSDLIPMVQRWNA